MQEEYLGWFTTTTTITESGSVGHGPVETGGRADTHTQKVAGSVGFQTLASYFGA